MTTKTNATHHSTPAAVLQPLEPRTLMTFAGLDPSYGDRGIARVVKSGPAYETTFPLADGGAVLRISEVDLRRVDANGKIVKAFGGGDGVLTPTGRTNILAVDRRTGRIAVVRGDGPPAVEVYSPVGTLERTIEAASLSGVFQLNDPFVAERMAFDTKGRLLVLNRQNLFRIDLSTGTLDATFGTAGRVAMDATPSGANGAAVGEIALLGLFVRPPNAGDVGGAVTVVRAYATLDAGGANDVDYLELTRLDRDGRPPAGGGVATMRLPSIRERANAGGGVDSAILQIVGLAPAADGSLTMLAQLTQRSDPAPLTGVGTSAFYSEHQLYRVTDRLGAPRNLDREFLVRPFGTVSAYDNGGGASLAASADGTRVAVLLNNRLAQFSTTSLKPFTSYNGPAGSLLVAAKRYSARPAIDARGRVLLNEGRQIRAILGPAADLVGGASGQATLLVDGTLYVSGTPKNDAVTIARADKERIAVTVNGRRQLFARDGLFGIVVRTGKGNDAVDLSGLTGTPLGAFVQGGSGDDRLIGSGNNDTLDAGDGRDAIDGGPGNDLALNATGPEDDVDDDELFATVFLPEPPLFA